VCVTDADSDRLLVRVRVTVTVTVSPDGGSDRGVTGTIRPSCDSCHLGLTGRAEPRPPSQCTRLRATAATGSIEEAHYPFRLWSTHEW
jgi:hypothetical protein